MVHFFRSKQTIEKLDIVSKINGWEKEQTKYLRTYVRGKQRVDVIKIPKGYKVIVSKNNVVWDTDVTQKLEHALILAGETIQYRVW